RHQGARPRAVVEQLRRAAMDLWQAAHCPLGPFRPSRSAAAIRRLRLPEPLVVGCAEGGKDGRPVVKARFCPVTTAKTGEPMCALARKAAGRAATAASQ